MARPADAETVILQFGAPKPFACYWLSKAQLAQAKKDEALASIERALEGLTAGQRRFRSAFLAQRFETRQALGDHVAAREGLKVACQECEDAKYRASLDRRLASLGK